MVADRLRRRFSSPVARSDRRGFGLRRSWSPVGLWAIPFRCATRGGAVVGSGLFFLLAPGTVVGLVPWWISGWRLVEPWPSGLRVLGAVLVVAGLVPLVHAFVQLVHAGAPGAGRRVTASTGMCATRCTS